MGLISSTNPIGFVPWSPHVPTGGSSPPAPAPPGLWAPPLSAQVKAAAKPTDLFPPQAGSRPASFLFSSFTSLHTRAGSRAKSVRPGPICVLGSRGNPGTFLLVLPRSQPSATRVLNPPGVSGRSLEGEAAPNRVRRAGTAPALWAGGGFGNGALHQLNQEQLQRGVCCSVGAVLYPPPSGPEAQSILHLTQRHQVNAVLQKTRGWRRHSCLPAAKGNEIEVPSGTGKMAKEPPQP